MNETTKNFLEVFSSLEAWQPPHVFFRLYYDNFGNPITYTMEDLPGSYIEIDAETYARQPRNIKIVNGKITIVNTKSSQKLIPSKSGTSCHTQDVCIIVSEEAPNIQWSLKTYATN